MTVYQSFHSVQCFVLVWLQCAILRFAFDACTIVHFCFYCIFFQVPAFDPTLIIDEGMHANFLQLFADNAEKDFQAALRHLGMFKPDDLYPKQERVSLTKSRMFDE